MPYPRERADKAAHSDIIKNPDVRGFLEECDYLKEPSDNEARTMVLSFVPVPELSGVELPDGVIAVDGSFHESSVTDRLPSTRVAFIKIGAIYIKLGEYDALKQGRFVDPYRVAALKDSNSALTFTLPSANIRHRHRATVRESFRAAVDDHLCGLRTRFHADDPLTSLRTTLFHLVSRRPRADLITRDSSHIRLERCPSCERGPVDVYDAPEEQQCPSCGGQIFPSDCLRLWEEVSEYQSNLGAVSRFAQVLEHLVPIHYIRYLLQKSKPALAATAFIIDRPLAIFGNSAWLHRVILEFLWEANRQLTDAGLPRFMVVGLQKSGQVVDHVRLVSRHLEPGTVFAVDDEYRYRYICSTREAAEDGFGRDTYYGQDFIYKTQSGREFVVALPYPCAHKKDLPDFHKAKTELERYPELARALALVGHFECDLYENSVVPIALAHRYTAISLMPGGRVLDIFTRKSLPKPRNGGAVSDNG
jgi:hypothetical protein